MSRLIQFPVSVWNLKKCKTRKQHECVVCGGYIPPNTECFTKTYSVPGLRSKGYSESYVGLYFCSEDCMNVFYEFSDKARSKKERRTPEYREFVSRVEQYIETIKRPGKSYQVTNPSKRNQFYWDEKEKKLKRYSGEIKEGDEKESEWR